MIIPKRWHIYIIDLEPRVGTKPGKQRPCVCIQPSEFCEAGLPSALVVPLTTKVRTGNAFPLRVRILQGVCDLPKESDALIEQILAWDIKLFKKDLGLLPEIYQDDMKTALRDFLDL
jgi:mRNA interferase MazF